MGRGTGTRLFRRGVKALTIDLGTTNVAVREWFNLTSILYDPDERTRFLDRIFHIVNTPQ